MADEVEALRNQLQDALKQLAAATAALEAGKEGEAAPAEPKPEPAPAPAPAPAPKAARKPKKDSDIGRVGAPGDIVFEGVIKTAKFGRVDTSGEPAPFPVSIHGVPIDYTGHYMPKTREERLEKWEDWGCTSAIQGPARGNGPLMSAAGKTWNAEGTMHARAQYYMYSHKKETFHPNAKKSAKAAGNFVLPMEPLERVTAAFNGRDVQGFRNALANLDGHMQALEEWQKVRVMERDVPRVLKPLMNEDLEAAYEFLEHVFDEDFLTEAREKTMVALFGEPQDLRPGYSEVRKLPVPPRNAEHIIQSVIQCSSKDDGWEGYSGLHWAPYSVMFTAHQSALQHTRDGYPLGKDPGDEPQNQPWTEYIQGVNYTHPDEEFAQQMDHFMSTPYYSGGEKIKA